MNLGGVRKHRTVQAAWLIAGITLAACVLSATPVVNLVGDLPLYLVALLGWAPWLVCVFAAIHLHGRPALWTLLGAPAVLLGPGALVAVLRAMHCASPQGC